MLVVTDSINIKGNLREVFRCFWNAELWPEITPHVKRIEMIEAGATRQQFRMFVQSNGVEHAMESVRERAAFESITYQQLQPPPIFVEHTGRWDFSNEDEGIVHVTLTHRVRINREKAIEILKLENMHEIERVVSDTLKRNGSLTMTAIKNLIEESAAAMATPRG